MYERSPTVSTMWTGALRADRGLGVPTGKPLPCPVSALPRQGVDHDRPPVAAPMGRRVRPREADARHPSAVHGSTAATPSPSTAAVVTWIGFPNRTTGVTASTGASPLDP